MLKESIFKPHSACSSWAVTTVTNNKALRESISLATNRTGHPSVVIAFLYALVVLQCRARDYGARILVTEAPPTSPCTHVRTCWKARSSGVLGTVVQAAFTESSVCVCEQLDLFTGSLKTTVRHYSCWFKSTAGLYSRNLLCSLDSALTSFSVLILSVFQWSLSVSVTPWEPLSSEHLLLASITVCVYATIGTCRPAQCQRPRVKW